MANFYALPVFYRSKHPYWAFRMLKPGFLWMNGSKNIQIPDDLAMELEFLYQKIKTKLEKK